VASALLSVLGFGWLSTGGTGRLIANEPLSDFYDYQAASLLQGRLDVPPEALSFEAFVYKDKTYGYFGITPALLRIPFVAVGLGFGQLSRLYMLGYFAAALVASYLILLHLLRLAGAVSTAPRPWLVVLFVANAGLGNTLFLLSSRAYVYHEAILCGAALALWSVWCGLRHFSAPHGRWWIGALGIGVLAVHARPPSGLFALTVIGVVACALARQRWQNARAEQTPFAWRTLRQPAVIGTLAALGVLSFNGMSYLKFETFNACPLQYHVQYQPNFDPGRLARFEGKQFHLSNIPFVFNGYVLRPNFVLSKYFPFVLMGPEPPQAEFPKAKMDWVEPTLGFPYAMPGLFSLAVLGSVVTFLRNRALRPTITLVWLSAVPMSAAMLSAVALAHRYTADFCPLFICASAAPLAALQVTESRWRDWALGVLTALTALAVAITALLTLDYQGNRIWGAEERIRSDYAALRHRVDAFLGVTNPVGYGTVNSSIRRVESAYYLWIAVSEFKKLETIPQAMAVYEKHLSDQLFFSEAHFAAAQMYLQKNEFNAATRALEKALTAYPNAADWQAKLGELLAAQGRTTEAIERYKIALQLIPGSAVVHNNIAVAYAKIGQLGEAVSHLEAALQVDPNNSEARNNIATLKSAMKK
jgi:tetratricopeptide (TPR) repeat protein